MSKLNSNEVFYWCHRETPFFACSYSQGGQQICRTAAPSRNQFVFFPRWYFASFTDRRTVSLRPPGHPSPSQREGPTGDPGSPGLKSLMTNGRLLCFFFFFAHSSRPGRPPKRLQSVTEGGAHHMLSHSGLMHAGIMPPAGDHPGFPPYCNEHTLHVYCNPMRLMLTKEAKSHTQKKNNNNNINTITTHSIQ